MKTHAQIPVADAVRRVPAALRPTVNAGRRTIMAVAPKGTKQIAYREWPTLFALDGYFVCGIAPKPRWVNISFFRGAELDDPEGVLEGTGKGMRHVKLRQPKDAASPALKRIVRRAFKLGGRDMSGRTPPDRQSRG